MEQADKINPMQNRGSMINWIKCPVCKEEYARLCQNGLCIICNEILQTQKDEIPKKTFNNFIINKNNQLIVEYCKDYFKHDRGIFLHGLCGVGKSHLAKAIYNEVPKTNDKIFVIFPELTLKIKDNFGTEKYTENELIDRCANPDYLFLDEIGGENITDFSIEKLFLILNRREKQNKKKVFITSNFNLEVISKLMSDRISSRISGLCEERELIDIDHRVTK